MTSKYLIPALLAVLVCTGASSIVRGQDRDEQWRKLASLSPGARVVVDQDSARSIKARFLRAADDALTVQTGGREIALPRAAVSAVYLGRRSSRLKPALIGALAGAGGGLLVSGVVVAVTKGDPLIGAGGFLIGIPVGAAIGAATGGGTKKGELIYSR